MYLCIYIICFKEGIVHTVKLTELVSGQSCLSTETATYSGLDTAVLNPSSPRSGIGSPSTVEKISFTTAQNTNHNRIRVGITHGCLEQ